MKIHDITKFAQYCGLIKKTKRSGWLRYLPAEKVESVADHSCRLSLLTLALVHHKGIDYKKCLEYAIIHDLAQGITGDFTPYDKVTDSQKKQLEFQAMGKIFGALSQQTKQYFLEIWQRYQAQQEIETKIVKDIDKYEMMQQAFEYEKRQNVDLSQFYKCAKNLKTDVIKGWSEDLIKLREQELKKFL